MPPAPALTVGHDPRPGRARRALVGTRLDELPQLRQPVALNRPAGALTLRRRHGDGAEHVAFGPWRSVWRRGC
jgi:hypothetical protein